LHFQNLEQAARRVVIEHADRQPPSIPSEGIAVYDMEKYMTDVARRDS
jgi:hypothetical protein